MVLNILNKDQSSPTTLQLTKKEFWKLYIRIKLDFLTTKEIDVLSDIWSGAVKEIRGNYRTYIKRLESYKIPLKEQTIPTKDISLHINIHISE